MLLLDRNGAKGDIWSREAGAPARLLPYAELGAALATGADLPFGIEIPNTVRVSDLEPYWDQLALIAITFPSFSDGRGYSIAKSLRHAGYSGTLRAVGPLIADQFAYALACGFDEVELPAAVALRQPIEIWQAAGRAFSATYQKSHVGLVPSILDQRRAQRWRVQE